MANKSDRFYYENLATAVKQCCQMTEYLAECLHSYDRERLPEMLDKMHDLERSADDTKHQMITALARAFVTPIDREDLAELSAKIDDVADGAEEVLQRFYMNDIDAMRPDAVEFADRLASCCKKTCDLIDDLEHFKKENALRDKIWDIGHDEELCDKLYIDARRRLNEECKDCLTNLGWREILNSLENCADACEHIADTVETIVMKNT